MANLTTIYSKIKISKTVENNTRPDAPEGKAGLHNCNILEGESKFQSQAVSKAITHNLKTTDVTVKIIGKIGERG